MKISTFLDILSNRIEKSIGNELESIVLTGTRVATEKSRDIDLMLFIKKTNGDIFLKVGNIIDDIQKSKEVPFKINVEKI